MKHVTPQQQVWSLLRTDDQKAIIAENLRHIKKIDQEDICMALVAFLRFGILLRYDDPWMKRQVHSLILYLKTERELKNI